MTGKERLMGRGQKPAKSKAEGKPSIARKSPKSEDSKVRELEKRLAESLGKQTATAEILRVIGSSPTDVQPVLDAIVSRVVRLCDAFFSTVWRYDGTLIHHAADNYPTAEMRAILTKGYPAPAQPGSVVALAISERRIIHVADLLDDAALASSREVAISLGYRTLLCVPMLRDGMATGAIAVARREQQPFSDRQIELVKTFADQAVIAIENVRLFNETKEALEQQTATSEILGVISRSPADVQPVFEAIAESAARLCDAYDASIFLIDGDVLRLAAHDGPIPASPLGQGPPLVRGTPPGRAVLDRQTIHVPDMQTEVAEYPEGSAIAQRFGHRTVLVVPLLQADGAIGAIAVRRTDVQPFSDRQIDLLKTFADQAVITIENVRLFKELQASNREIAEKSRQIEIASQHKSEFLANMSHELRTPLNAIIGFSEVLTERMFGDLNEKQEEYLKDIYASGTHLLSLINDILDLSKIEAGRMELELTDFDLPQAIDNALILVRERAGRRGIALEHSVDERLGEIRGDERKVKQVLLNLLSNALKFTPEGGRVDVQVGIVGGMAEISVTDTGVGIAPEDQGAIFEEFRQVGTAEKKAEGTGLGLTLCRKFVELHGGRIWVKSQLGLGSTFTFSIPARRGE
jgi:signal transduction histidine kinase